ncbi:MAG TPA: acetyl-CoA hydrolase/transferase family protein [candidate division WOR-3 bacterium]|uniref:Acetyl-CoA hydrolase/transferase family protein n=1 Tax=candidate division WOR-3 bacterium TaxID=2052148 RepID=A0A9C9END0_UNCW3|nr:acetyl-CoA hydrolase/transferase family protein [candidate division WOR-3 bacterium]
MSWFDNYKKKKCSIEEAVSVVKSNDRVYISGNAATPFRLMEALAQRKDELKNVEIAHVLLFGDDPLSKPGMEGHFRHNSLFVGPADRAAVNEGKADYIPVFLYEIPQLFYSGELPIDVAFMHLSPPDEHGFMSYGVECLASKAAAETAKTVIAQVNEKMPRTLGDSFIHVSRVAKIVEISEELPELEPIPFTEVEKRIGLNIAGLVEDGSTLQLGIGGIPNAALKAMFDKKDLGVHTEMVSDSIMEAIEAGVITGAKKTLHHGKIIATFYLGTKQLYEFIDNNPIFETHPTEYTNHPFIIRQNEKMVAINSAIEVDLTGQVCSDSIGTRIYSGFGGQVDFIRGAAQSKGGKPIIALPSTAKGGKISKIVPTLQIGAGVVTTRADVHYIVTEYGVAYLHGKNLRQRAEALISIAHPDFREMLEQEAKKRRLL